MLGDTVRREAYCRAMRRAIREGDTVLEIGSGPGYFALEAARLGAAKVWALEPADIVSLAQEIVRRNGFEDRIECLQMASAEFRPESEMDVVVSDLRGILPLFEGNVAAIEDARTRLLRPGGRLIPQRDELWGAVVTAPDTWTSWTEGWEQPSWDLEPAREAALHIWRQVHLDEAALLTAPERWNEIDYREARADARVQGVVRGVADRTAKAHGLAIWFETDLYEGIGFSNRPGAPRTLYGQGFFPFLEPLSVKPGDRFEVEVVSMPKRGEYIWRWSTRLATDDPERDKAFDQSTFFGVPVSRAKLARRSDGHRACLTSGAQLLRFVLDRMDGEHTNDQIAVALYQQFPGVLASPREALARVADIAERHGGGEPAQPEEDRPTS